MRNIDHLRKEVLKPKPKPEVVRELVKRTLPARRSLVLDGKRPGDMIEEFPHLKKASYVRFGCI